MFVSLNVNGHLFFLLTDDSLIDFLEFLDLFEIPMLIDFHRHYANILHLVE